MFPISVMSVTQTLPKSTRLRTLGMSAEIAARLRTMIEEGELPPGARIDERAFCEMFDVSKTPLREALKVLAAEGLVRLEPRRGCFVNALSEQDLDEIFPLMALLEGRCAYEAARNATAEDLDALESLHADERSAEQGGYQQ